ncbi:hypothetical protein NIES2135_66300 (plasmid) [Leptolyngbya boryana NIES-2135]|jgi:hypothetical protein|uniref:Uncharacterized protein n=1 Tax=Leptolyngbya boryana NIES-2135 TaxID=1973484 RepID=A0A1Z4JSX4_LEPBY|nr:MULTISPECIES: hypothetical protein [Leptolyngbya]BAY59753.1 hypothetical protein NIES2135_66300 [Leptolyngbya boryana NIES-2135]MBD2370594.1 hypothetical protein [Leptolyngbya sp. FACHB-161]MBD2377014.1 hypothetical protein [Leptolyngbya sp. FACHB-238]MBD2401390.1 hypothetical protein [Leptolyngbya sp. FACHB-239]MBD2407941.1 hypothetical protein [Leptolyngbya sp. FACHB-402]
MGAWFVNYQVWSDSQVDVSEIVEQLSSGKCYISPPEGGWISVYDEMAENYQNPQLYEYIANIVSSISSQLNTSVFAFIVFSGVEFFYFLYKDGQVYDEFCSDPQNSFTFGFKKFNEEVQRRFQGNPESLLSYSISGTTLEEIIEVLSSIKKGETDYLGEDGILHLAPLLGMNEDRAIQGYNYIEDEFSLSKEYRSIPDIEDFIFIDHQQISG